MNRDYEMARKLAEKVAEKGGRAYFVGGYVRDLLRKQENKDIDVEIHGIFPEVLEEILDELGSRMDMGKSFGIQGIKGYSLDIAMPRRERKIGSRHTDFDVSVDPFIGIRQAALRRDFTINAMMQDVLTGEIIDFFGGKEDLENGILRHMDPERFGEDPLRVLRAAQFAARFGFSVADETIRLCSTMQLDMLSRERVFMELEKAMVKSEKPSVFFEVLRSMDQLDVWFPEIQALIGIPQNPYYHSEGDVWVHTMMVLDEGAHYRERTDDPRGFMLACLTHDLGKITTTTEKDGRIISHGHETEGLALAETFLERITSEKKRIAYVLNLVENHMKPNILAFEKAGVKATNRMFDQAMDPAALIYIAMADSRGKISQYEYISFDDYLTERLQIYQETMAKPFVQGRDLLERGITPGAHYREILEYAHKLRLAGIEKEEALNQTMGFARSLEHK